MLKEIAAMQLPISPEMLLSQLDFPDTNKMFARARAELEVVEMIIDKLLDPENPTYIQPEESMNLEMAVQHCRQAYYLAMSEGAEDIHLDNILNFINEAEGMLKEAAEAEMAAAAQPQGQPPVEGGLPQAVGGQPIQ